jgi:Asp-tRNA(Asn)/Glu-tRNA(Gln) amidotransferase A subunit family amidase
VSSADVPLHALSVADAVAAIARGSLAARALADAQLARVAATDSTIDAWATLDPPHVRAEASRFDAAPRRAALGGVGVGIKDIIHTRDLPTQMGSPAFDGHRSDTDAECVARLREAGAYVFGKTVTTELAFMHPSKTRNPWNAAHSPGGSSSGSAAAVAAGHVAAALGTQTNGSVVRPAAYCGVVGYKPSLGAISFAGASVFSETLDTIGTFTRSVADAALLAGALSATGTIAAAGAAASPRLAFLAQFPWSPVDAATEAALAAAMRALADGSASVERVTLPATWRDTPALLRTIMLAEAARNLDAARRRHGAHFSAKLNDALDEGAAIAPSAYQAALDRRTRMIDEAGQFLSVFDAIVTPSAPAAAPAGFDTTGDPSCCTLWSLLGAPALNLPIAVGAAGLPLGLQLAARPGDDARLLGVAAWCETQLPFPGRV